MGVTLFPADFRELEASNSRVACYRVVVVNSNVGRFALQTGN